MEINKKSDIIMIALDIGLTSVSEEQTGHCDSSTMRSPKEQPGTNQKHTHQIARRLLLLGKMMSSAT